MKQKFEVSFMDEALSFINSIDKGAKEKIVYNMKLASMTNNPELLKKLTTDIWEFRSRYKKIQYRLFAFWDKQQKSFIICTHGIVKKTQKTPKQEIEKAIQLMKQYYQS